VRHRHSVRATDAPELLSAPDVHGASAGGHDAGATAPSRRCPTECPSHGCGTWLDSTKQLQHVGATKSRVRATPSRGVAEAVRAGAARLALQPEDGAAGTARYRARRRARTVTDSGVSRRAKRPDVVRLTPRASLGRGTVACGGLEFCGRRATSASSPIGRHRSSTAMRGEAPARPRAPHRGPASG
jgi:hypothetical protein